MPPGLTRAGRLRTFAAAAALMLTAAAGGGQAAHGEAATTAAAAAELLLAPHGKPWFGPDLDWNSDTSQAYSRRLGVDPSLIGRSVGYPLTDDGRAAVRDLLQRSSTAGAVAVLTLAPSSIEALTTADARGLVQLLRGVATAHPSYVLVRFGPEMNGSWTPWGRRPQTYVAKFRQLANVLHGSNVQAAMVWTPAYGAGYPFSRALNATMSHDDGNASAPIGRRNLAALDTDHDGRLTDQDDPYGPYYPGDAAVDWVGLTMLRYGAMPTLGANTVPKAGELDSRFKETFGYGDDRSRATFYVRFSGKAHQPFLLVTGVRYDPAQGGAPEAAVKAAWLRQVVDAARNRPLLAGVEWLEQERDEPEIGNRVNWRLSSPASVVPGARRILTSGGLTLAPVDLPVTAPLSVSGGSKSGTPEQAGTDRTTTTPTAGLGPGASDQPWTDTFAAGMLTTLVVLLVAGFAVSRVRRRRMMPPWLR